VFIKSLSLQNFRNHARTVVEFGEGINVLVGDNAQGKTNLIEAIYMTCIGRGFKSPRDREVIKFGQDFAKVKTTAVKKFGKISVEIAVSTIQGKAGKSIKINEVPITRTGELMGTVPCVFFNPDELKLVKEAPADRRRFMDIDISQIDKIYFYNLLRYNKVLKQRNALLKSIGTSADEMRSLDIWDEQLATLGEQIINRRVLFCEELKKEVVGVHKVIAPGETIEVAYEGALGDISPRKSSASPADNSLAKHAPAPLLSLLKSARANDLRLRTTTVGPHRDDIALSINGKDVRGFASQGQQRTVALSLKIAELKIFERVIGEKPVLLLDDVLSELDARRQAKLLDLIKEWQSIITTTEFSSQAPLAALRVFKVASGAIVNT